MSNNPLNLLRMPWRTICSSLTAINFSLSRKIVQLSLASCPRDMSDELFNFGMIDAFFACDDKRNDKGKVPSSFD